MEEKTLIQEIRQDIREIKTDVSDIKTNTSLNTASLTTHIRRTDLNEKRIQMLEYWLLGLMGSALVAIGARLLLK